MSHYWTIAEMDLNPKNVEIANDYLMYLYQIKKSEQTITRYKYILIKFLRDHQQNLNDLTCEEVRDWLSLNYDNKRETTHEQAFCVLSGFFKYSYTENYVDKLLIRSRWKPKIPYTTPKYLSEKDIVVLKHYLEKRPLRDRTVILFMLASGTRRGEATGLNITDLDLAKRKAEVIGKGNKKRTVFFTEEVALILKAYLQNRHDNEPAVFLNKFNKRLQGHGLYQLVRRIGKKLNINLYCHLLRHSYATQMLSKGASIETIAEHLGENDIDTARRYASVLTGDLNSWYRRSME